MGVLPFRHPGFLDGLWRSPTKNSSPPTIISVAVVLRLVCIAAWIVLNPCAKTYGWGNSDGPMFLSTAQLDVSIDSKDYPTVDGMGYQYRYVVVPRVVTYVHRIQVCIFFCHLSSNQPVILI
jgi:hypothetical protein